MKGEGGEVYRFVKQPVCDSSRQIQLSLTPPPPPHPTRGLTQLPTVNGSIQTNLRLEETKPFCRQNIVNTNTKRLECWPWSLYIRTLLNLQIEDK
jgi:hypothetical protein